MANVLHRSTREYLRSVHGPAYPMEEWIHDPILEAVEGYQNKYWIVTGDTVSLMNQAQRDAVDAADLIAIRDSAASELSKVESILRAFMLVVIDEFNAHALKHNAILTAIDSATSLADLKTRVGTITDYPSRTTDQLRTAIRNKLGS